MKGIGVRVGVSAAVASLLLATAAMAATRGFTGTVPPGGSVSFAAKFHNHRAVRVKDFVFSGVGAMCNEGATQADISHSPLPPMPVNALHRFHGRFKITGTNDRVRVRGVFKHHGRRAHGRLRLRGDYSGSTGCDTGRQRWKAHRG